MKHYSLSGSQMYEAFTVCLDHRCMKHYSLSGSQMYEAFTVCLGHRCMKHLQFVWVTDLCSIYNVPFFWGRFVKHLQLVCNTDF